MKLPLIAVMLAAGGCGTAQPVAAPTSWIASTEAAPARPTPIAEQYREVATKILAAARGDDHAAYRKLAFLTDHIGNRIAGSPALEAAIQWATRAMADDGLVAKTEAVMVPHWVRGAESGAIVSPIERTIRLIGLGYSVPTPKGGLTAPVVVATSWADLEAKKDAVKGAIVLFDVAMPVYSDDKGSGYGETVEYRTQGAIRAAKLGAVAVLVRSVTAHAMRVPHTGAVKYDDAVPKIPAAAVTVEDASLIRRLAGEAGSRGVAVHLELESQRLPDAPSANVIGELVGKDKPDEVVVIGAHIDSWDVGQGAHDDGAGDVIVMQAAATLKKLGLQPKRTIRVVLFANEENGINGAKAYAADHAGELGKTVLAMEADSGGFKPRGFSVGKPDGKDPKDKTPDLTKQLVPRITDIASLLTPLGATRVVVGHGGADISPMAPAGVPQVGLDVDGRTYFDIHHSEADTLDKVDPAALADDVAAVAIFAYVVADLPEPIGKP